MRKLLENLIADYLIYILAVNLSLEGGFQVEKIALITDSTSDLSEEIISNYNINVLPFRIIYKDREYLDNVDITPEEVYANLENEMPTSSLPSMKDMEKLFNRLDAEGYTHAIAVTLSSGLSGIYNAIKLVSENHTNIKTYVHDSKSISQGEGFLVEEIGKLIAAGEKFQDILDEIPKIKNRIHLFFLVGTLEYLKKGGRIGLVAGSIGQLLNIKPIIAIQEDGKYYTSEKIRGRKKSLKRITEIGKELLEKNCKICVMYGNAKEEATKVYEALKEMSNSIKKGTVHLGKNISPVSGVHSGPGLIGIVGIEQ